MDKKDLLKKEVRHIDITDIDSVKIIESMQHMSFSSRDLANASQIFCEMLADKKCSIILTLAGSTQAAGCMKLYADMVKYNMVDAIVATGASIVDMDFFEAIGFKHYQGSQFVEDKHLRALYIDRIYDTYINEDDLQQCDFTISKIADSLPVKSYSSREFIYEMGRYLKENGTENGKNAKNSDNGEKNSKKKDSLIELAYEYDVPIFCPAFTDSSAGFGLVHHQVNNKDNHITIDSVRDFKEITEVKIKAGTTGLLMVGGGAPKNFAQDTVVCAEILGKNVDMHKYAVQITVADVRDGACSSSTLKEACSWGKVDSKKEQMVFSEATIAMPLLASFAYHKGAWKNRSRKRYNQLFT